MSKAGNQQLKAAVCSSACKREAGEASTMMLAAAGLLMSAGARPTLHQVYTAFIKTT